MLTVIAGVGMILFLFLYPIAVALAVVRWLLPELLTWMDEQEQINREVAAWMRWMTGNVVIARKPPAAVREAWARREVGWEARERDDAG